MNFEILLLYRIINIHQYYHLKKKKEEFLTILQVSAMGTEQEGFFLSYKSEVEVNVKCMPHTKTI